MKAFKNTPLHVCQIRHANPSYKYKSYFVNPLTPVPPVTVRGEPSSTSDVITFDQNWHHLYSTSAGGKDLSNDAQIRVIGRMEP